MITVNGVVKWKTGEITASILDFVEFLGEATFTEMNKFYLKDIQGYKEYDPVRNRGGSFCHHLTSLKEPRKRMFDGRYRYLVKQSNGKWKVNEVHKMFT
jgi:hypothetical protein